MPLIFLKNHMSKKNNLYVDIYYMLLLNLRKKSKLLKFTQKLKWTAI